MRDFGVVLNEPVKPNVDSTACMDAVGRRGRRTDQTHCSHARCGSSVAVAERRRLLEERTVRSQNPADVGIKALEVQYLQLPCNVQDSDGLMEPQQ